MNETPERPGFYEEDFYDWPEQRDDPTEDDRKESIIEAEFEKRVADELVNIVIPDLVMTRRQAK